MVTARVSKRIGHVDNVDILSTARFSALSIAAGQGLPITIEYLVSYSIYKYIYAGHKVSTKTDCGHFVHIVHIDPAKVDATP